MLTDTQRLDAMIEYGLFISAHETLGKDGWTKVCVICYRDRQVVAPTIREAIDAAVLDITTGGQLPN